MVRRLERRVASLEGRFPPQERTSWLVPLLPYMTLLERTRLWRGYALGLVNEETFQRDAAIILEAAQARQQQGWCQSVMDGLNQEERLKSEHLWALVMAIRRRHPGFYPDVDRFDVLDLSLEEIDLLTEAVSQSSNRDDLMYVEHLIRRLRIDGRKATRERFAAIVFDAALPEATVPLWQMPPNLNVLGPE